MLPDQVLATKARFIAQVMSGDRSVRRVEDVGMHALSYDEVKAIASGNPAVREKALLDAELARLQLLRKAHIDKVWRAKNTLVDRAQWAPKYVERMQRLREQMEQCNQAGDTLVWEGHKLADPELIAKALSKIKALERKCRQSATPKVVATYAGAPLCVIENDLDARNGFYFKLGDSDHTISANHGGDKLHYELAKEVGRFKQRISSLEGTLESWRHQEPMLQAIASGAFEHEERILELRSRLVEVEAALGLHKDMAEVAQLEDGGKVANHTSLDAADAALLAEDGEDQEGEEAADADDELEEAFPA